METLREFLEFLVERAERLEKKRIPLPALNFSALRRPEIL